MAVVDQVHGGDLDALDVLIATPGGGPSSPAPGDPTSCTSRPASTSLAGWPRRGRTRRRVPVFVERGAGSRVWDVDGTEYVDLHGGFGTMLAGHGHPAIVAAVTDRVVAGHALRPTDARHHPGRRRAGPPLRPAVVALRQLRHRVDDGRHPPHAGGHRAHPPHQGRGHLPRPPRRRAGVGVPGRRRLRPTRTSRRRCASTAPSRPRSPPSCTSSRSVASTRCAGCCSTTRARSPG